MSLSIFSLGIGLFLFWSSINNLSLISVSAIFLGIGYSGTFTMIQLLIADFFMGKSFGSILGIFMMIDTLAGSAGIYLLGSFRKSSGDYSSAFLTMIFI